MSQIKNFKGDIPLEFLGTERRIEKFSNVIGKRQKSLTIIAENVNDPHNLSAVIRSCDAVGILEVCLVYHGGQAMPLYESSSASAKKWVETKYFDNVKDCFDYVRSSGKKIYTTHMSSNAVSLYDLDLANPIALVFGNEHAGVSQEALELADGNFLIPQVGMIQSLNISVACAVSIYEAFRQRLAKGLYDNSELSPQEQSAKLQQWLRK